MATSKAKTEPIVFLASLPPIGSAIKRSGNNDGMRVQIDIPESEMGNAIRLNLCGQKVLKVTVEVFEDSLINSGEQHEERQTISARPKRKSERTPAEKPSAD